MECLDSTVSHLSWALILGGVAYLLHQTRDPARYGRYVTNTKWCCSARLGWFVQEVPAFLLPLLLLLLYEEDNVDRSGRTLLLYTFMLHYFHRSFIYAFLTRGRPIPIMIVISAAIFCSLNGFLQGHFLLHCFQLEHTWWTDLRLCAGICLFVVGMIINIDSDRILRKLRKPGEITYSIPQGGMFEFISGANFFGEIVEWCGYAVATWSFPTFSFAFFTICSIGPRAYLHHRFYQKKFKDYPRNRKALIPFVL
ncbi:3-oxo-5-alpha-steroid 4-dehydrogenase 2-like [Sphaeramia orbicularis]|uniref:3-oxo-5-alpha-steroid 4-dehydrogenase 2-like n=1 Tax=Sphaeramia orbicularis TaxID=375764 RepID=UPI00117D7676|nr:3-oxo-5-alpha-steroid 4-dehydrogenase 2-like [Sphaeramia orbicularis]XP_030016865.1 3-oxo-5-alpha-steroid 4-dehydrogenase 2-like [Sphaeramia orbicularis]